MASQHAEVESLEVAEKVFTLLKEVMGRSYSPYSKFQVGCVIEMDDGSFVQGCNVENASYSMTICAERSAITAAISQGFTPHQMKRFFVVTKLGYCVYPCGACRSVISEMNPDAEVVAVCCDGSKAQKRNIKHLLPESFSARDLNL